MLIRALFLSALLHLVIVLSLTHLDVALWPENSGRNANALNMRLGQLTGQEAPDPDFRSLPIVDANSRTPVRQHRQMPDQKKARSDFGRFSRSTAATAESGKAESRPSLEVTSPEAQIASAEALGEYRLNVARSARQFKVYPSQARERGWEGVVHLSIAMPIGHEGSPSVALERSSGYAVLDRQALEMVERAVSMAILPEAMRGRGLIISLPVDYRLAD